MTQKRHAEIERKTKETDIQLEISLDGEGRTDISTGIPFFDHMLTLFAVHGFMDLSVRASGDISVDYHHTVEDVGLVLGDAVAKAVGDRKGIRRFGHAVTPMDEALATVAIDLSNRPFLVYSVPHIDSFQTPFDLALAEEFFRAFSNRSGMNLHIHVPYGENGHHIVEAIFKACGRALDQAVSIDQRLAGVLSSKGRL